MNALEETIFDAAIRADKQYAAMSGGYWLWHAPESLIQHVVARAIFEKDFYVFIDATGFKAHSDIGPKRGRKSSANRKRFDLTVWYKSSDSLRAVIEIKRAWSDGELRKDANKIRTAMQLQHAPNAGYMLVYSDSKKVETLEARFNAIKLRKTTNNSVGCDNISAISSS